MSACKLNLVIRRKCMLTDDICEFELCDPSGASLPEFTPGAHVNITTPAGHVRSYSLSNDHAETHRYVIAVKRERDGRGGSRSIVDEAHEGTCILLSPPSNAFALVDAKRCLLIAGGIGITPILAMLRAVVRRGAVQVQLIYCTRSARQTAYRPELLAPPFAALVTLHHDLGRPSDAFDFWPLFRTPDPATHIYCCGPTPLMEHVRALTMHWPESAIHFEDFAGVSAVNENGIAFRIRRAASGEVYEVPANRSALDALRNAGFKMRSSCESGTCGTCRTRLVSGEVEHRDLVLTELERRQYMMPCVSRAAGDEIELDF